MQTQQQSDLNIKAFVANIADKDYSRANLSLQKIIEDKLKQRINFSITQKKPTNLDK